MKLPYIVTTVNLHVSSFSGAKTYTIKGTQHGFGVKIQLSEPEWKTLCEAYGHTISVGDELVVELPGDFPEDEDLEEEEAEG